MTNSEQVFTAMAQQQCESCWEYGLDVQRWRWKKSDSLTSGRYCRNCALAQFTVEDAITQS